MKVDVLPAIALFALVISVVSALIYIPSSTSYSPWNTGGNGLSELVEDFNGKPVGNLNKKLCNKTVIIVLGKALTSTEAENISNLINCGSTVIIADSHGYSSQLFDYLGISLVFHNYTILDEISKLDYRWWIKVNTSGIVNEELVIPNITYVEMVTKPDYLYAYTSPFAYIDKNQDGVYSTADQMGSFIALGGWKKGSGSIILIPSTLFFTNNYLKLAENRDFVRSILNGSSVYIYTKPLNLPPIDSIKLYVFSWTSRGSSWIVLFIGLTVSSILTYIWVNQYIDKNRVNRKLLVIILLLASAPYMINAIQTGNILYLAPVILVSFLTVFDRNAFLSLSIALALLSVIISPLYIGLYITLLLVLSAWIKPGIGQSFLGSSSISLIVLQLINSLLVFIYLPIIISLTAASLFLLALSLGVYTFILRSTMISTLDAPEEGYVDAPINLVFAVNTKMPVRLVTEIGKMRTENIVKPGGDTVSITYKPEHSGLNRMAITMGLTDLWSLSWRSIDTITLEINVLPQVFKMLKRAESLLAGIGTGDLLSKISVILMIRSDELGDVSTEITGEQLAELARKSGGPGGIVHGLVKRIIQEYLDYIGSVKSRIGEYVGVRMYVPGDDPRNIHWKKSLSIHRLVLKEYVTSGGEAGSTQGGKGDIVFIVNLDCSRNVELDALLTRILGLLINSSIRDPSMNFNLLLVSGRVFALLQGSVVAVLNLLYRALKNNPLELKYNYRSSNKYLDLSEIKYMTEKSNAEPFNAMSTSLLASLKRIVESLVKHSLLPPMQFTLLHCRATSSWASFLVHLMVETGYEYRREDVLR